MKNFVFAIITSIALLLAGCTTDGVNETGIRTEGITSLTITTEPTRTSLGEKVGESYPLYWSKGDKIVVNGIPSDEAEIDATNQAVAHFTFGEELRYPLSIVYPYAATATSTQTVVIPSVQHYTEGTFSPLSAPMCGYVENSSEKATLKHLVGLLKLSIVGNKEGIVLDKVVITSTNGAKLSGEFTVNCSAGTMTACESSSESITYSLPENFTLSTNKESQLFISIPAGDTSNCSFAFIESSGDKMVCSWNSTEVKAGIVREFETITYKRGFSGALSPMQVEEDTFTIYYPTIEGYVKETQLEVEKIKPYLPSSMP